MSTEARELERRRRRQAEALRANLRNRKLQAERRAEGAERRQEGRDVAEHEPADAPTARK